MRPLPRIFFSLRLTVAAVYDRRFFAACKEKPAVIDRRYSKTAGIKGATCWFFPDIESILSDKLTAVQFSLPAFFLLVQEARHDETAGSSGNAAVYCFPASRVRPNN
jgi:hypothetical protein